METNLVNIIRFYMTSIDIIVVFMSFIIMLMYLYLFSKNKKYALIKFYLDERIKKSFLIIAVATIIYSIGIFIEMFTLSLGIEIGVLFSESCYLTFYFSTLYFSYSLFKSVRE